jgi:hypothetical protein
MSRLTGSETKNLVEAYYAIYARQEEVNEEFTQADLEVEIFEAVSYALISQGHTANDVLEYFANVDDEVIIEDLVALSEGTLIVESVVSEEYIEEQMQQLDEIIGAALRIGGAALKAAKFAPKGGAGKAALGAAGRAAQRVAQQGTKASAVVRPALGRAVQAVKGAASSVKSKIGGAVSKVKDVAKGALNKLPGGSGGKLAGAAKLVGKAALGGVAFEGGMRAVRGLTSGKGSPSAPKAAPTGDKAKFNASAALGGKTAFAAGGGSAAMKKDPKLTAADIQKKGNEALFKGGGGKAAMGGKSRAEVIAAGTKATAPKKAPAAPAAPSRGGSGGGGGGGTGGGGGAPTAPKAAPSKAPDKQSPAKLGSTSFERRTPTSAEFKGAQEKRSAGGSPEDVLKAAQTAGKAQKSVDADLKKANSPEQLNKPAPAGSALAAEQEKRKKAQTTTSESYDAYDLVLEYLFSYGHAETMEEAHYIMSQMDDEMVQEIYESRAMAHTGGKPHPLQGDGSRPKGIQGGVPFTIDDLKPAKKLKDA